MIEATFSMAVFWQQRVCAVCGEPASDAHHIVQRSNPSSDDHVDNGLALCHACHMAWHDGVEDVRRAAGSALTEWPEKIQHVHRLLGDEAPRYLARYYGLEA